MKSSKYYRGCARNNLKGNWGIAIAVSLTVLAISTLLGFIPVVGTIASLLLVGQLAVGELNFYIKLTRNEGVKFGSVFEGFGEGLIKNFLVYLLETIYIMLWSILFVIPGIIKSYSYAMTMYLKAKRPELGANEAITLSRKIMNGKKWKLFCLHLSFFGWMLLGFLTFGIGFIFLQPYMQASVTKFYEDAYAEYNQVEIE